MIGYIKGIIIDKSEKSLLLLAGNVGYKIYTTAQINAEEVIGKNSEFYIHTFVKENDISLYGFLTKEELEMFEKLISISGIGPKIALEILSTPLNLLKTAILGSDIETLSKIKGLGKKTAERISIELRNKITVSSPSNQGEISTDSINQEAVLALESLGYERFYILKSLSKLPRELKETEEIIKFVLKNQ